MTPSAPEQRAPSQDSATPASFQVSAPAINLPKGGGAIRGIGEKFAANPVTGSGSMSVPIACSPGRAGFGPQLSLSYDSGAGNGPFGFGWSLSLPSITRKTDKGLPQYFDAEDSDVFILSGAEDLVPVLRQNPQGALVIHEDLIDGYLVRRYRPRIEGLFARIERWSKVGKPENVHWRSISKDNILTLYGLAEESRILDPLDKTRIFSWLICETRDDKGNAVVYGYKPEDGVGVPLGRASERNRGPIDDPGRTANRYLKRIQYGNRKSLLDANGQRPRFLTDDDLTAAKWMFEAVLDYDDHDPKVLTPSDVGKWTYRSDAFSSYRSGFEVRTTRLCQRVLMFHHFPDENGVGANCLVRSTDFDFSHEQAPNDARNPIYSFLQEVTQTSYRRKEGGYDQRSLPPVEFTYTEPTVQDTVEEVDAESLQNLPIGVDGSTYRWTDLHGEGIPGILTEQAGAWFYKRNLSPIPEKLADGREQVKVRLAALETVASKPNVALTGGAEFMDLAGDGQPDVVVMEGPAPGLYEHDEAEGWQPFRPFTSRLNRNLHDPNLKFVDLDGDGHADLLISEDDAFVWHASLAETGFGPARRVAQTLDEEKGPRIVFADGTQSIYLADLSGDGLTDIARIRNGEVCYWPNLGYGRFGAKVTMDHAPLFDNPDQFDHKRLRLADIDGSGTTDLIYLHRDGVRLYFNQSGNGWSAPQQLKVFPRIDDVQSIIVTDLLGNGTACLVWSSPLPGDARRPMRYVNLMGGQKPHLLIKTVNNLGAETRVHYAPSTRFYLQDKYDGKPWITRLPFPVHVVERVETYDWISRSRFVSRYAYHHGYFDGEEREFRGFGMGEQWDTEEHRADSQFPDAVATNWDAASWAPPVHTKTWFHTGAFVEAGMVSRQYAGEYWVEPALRDAPDLAQNERSQRAAQRAAMLLPDTVLDDTLDAEEMRQAYRALKGSALRIEVYAEDGSTRAAHPYTVTEQNFAVRLLQAQGTNRHAVFFTHASEAISYRYERNPEDPRIGHSLTLEVDGFGNVLKTAAVGYGRRKADASLPTDDDRTKQQLIHITYTENTPTKALDKDTDHYRTPLPAESRTYELRKPVQDKTATGLLKLYSFDEMLGYVRQAGDGLHDVAYENIDFEKAKPAAAKEAKEGNSYFRRLIEHVRVLYRPDDLGAKQNDRLALLPLRTLEPLALPGETYKLAFTSSLLDLAYVRDGEKLLPANRADVLTGGGYVDLDRDGRWWIPAGRMFFSRPNDDAPTELAEARKHFFLPHCYRDPFGHDTVVAYDGPADPKEPPYDLLVISTRDALGNTITAVNDYRVLQPRLITDPNGNRSEVRFDTFGMVTATAVMGKVSESKGDRLAGFTADPTAQDLLDFLANPKAKAAGLLGDATTRIVYDLHRYVDAAQPVFAATLARETHGEPAPPQVLEIQVSLSYSDGFGREIQKKIQAEPERLPNGSLSSARRWVGSGWTVFNNKGKPVRQYEPFFTGTHEFEFDLRIGVSPILIYDPAERVVATLHPNHTWEKVVFDPWQQKTWDVNDTLDPDYQWQVTDPKTAPNAGFDPADDRDVGGFFAKLPRETYWPTWYFRRVDTAEALTCWPDQDADAKPLCQNAAIRRHEQEAARKSEAHANTPTVAHFDSLGRPFLTVAHNRVQCQDHPGNNSDETYETRVELDIEGNQREVLDAKGRVVMRYKYDLLANRIHQASMEAGQRWMLNDVAGKPIRAWDSRGHNFSTTYDSLRRPVAQYVRGTTTNSDPRTLLTTDLQVDKIEYGEGLPNAQALNLRTRIYRHFDSAGVATNARLDASGNPLEAYDFKGNLLGNTRRLVSDYTAIPDWLMNPSLDDETFEGSTRYDALNRPVQSIAPHSSLARAKRSVIQPVFNEANLLERVDVWLERATEPTTLLNPVVDAASPVGVANIDYDAKGQRQRIDYKNAASTFYDYDPLTFRLTHLYTRRGAAFTEDCDNPPPPPTIAAPDTPPQGKACGLQNLHYTYDPTGNIIHIQDDAQQTIYFRNQRVEPSNDYTYDALYRLIQATGREHLGQQSNGDRNPPTAPDAFNAFHTRLDHPNERDAMGTYIERYVYDAVGNFLQMQHRGSDPAHAGWTRTYDYAEASLIKDGSGGTSLKISNRLSRTTLDPNGANPLPECYLHDAHGNMVRMPHLGGGLPGSNMYWDYKDQLRRTELGGGGAAFYVYDASGQRVRKVWEKLPGLTEERIYLGGFEVFRKHAGPIGDDTATLERETLHVMDDTQRTALVETRTLGSEPDVPHRLIRYQFGNHLGSSSLEMDEQAQIISYEEYSPYGSSTYRAVRSQTETAKRYRYTGKERDEESGLYYHGARYYAAWLGRWAGCDPEGARDALSLYVYVASRPVIAQDPSGRFLVVVVVSAGVVLLGLWVAIKTLEASPAAQNKRQFDSATTDEEMDSALAARGAAWEKTADVYAPAAIAAAETGLAVVGGPSGKEAGLERSALTAKTKQELANNAPSVSQGLSRAEVVAASSERKAASSWKDFLPGAKRQLEAQKAEFAYVAQANPNQSHSQRLLPAWRAAKVVRDSPGTAFASEELHKVSGTWLKGTNRNAGVMPRQIADQLAGRRFKSFAELREEFWKLVARDSGLSREFDKGQRTLMEKGYSPFAKVTEATGAGRANEVYNLHHIKSIEEGGSVYDLANIRIVTPRFHMGQH